MFLDIYVAFGGFNSLLDLRENDSKTDLSESTNQNSSSCTHFEFYFTQTTSI